MLWGVCPISPFAKSCFTFFGVENVFWKAFKEKLRRAAFHALQSAVLSKNQTAPQKEIYV